VKVDRLGIKELLYHETHGPSLFPSTW
jgi:hypothetical protein